MTASKTASFWSEEQQDDEIREMFRGFDKNGDGKLTVRELTETMSEMHGLNRDHVKQMFADLGKSKKDKFVEAEFIEMFKAFIEGDMVSKGESKKGGMLGGVAGDSDISKGLTHLGVNRKMSVESSD